MLRGGPWGFGDVLVLLSPIAFLVAMVLKPKPMPTTQSLWLAALLLFVLKLWYLEAAPLEACACFIKGCLQALTPCSIVAGAIFLFDCMESSQCLGWMKVQMRIITNFHPVAEVMLIGFCFAFIVEGASGFGTPAALAAPMLYSMGHPKLESVVCLLMFNTFMTIFGAVGTPVWFGIGEAVQSFEDSELLGAGFCSAVAMAASAMLLVPCVVLIIVPWAEVRPSLPFVLMSTASVVVPFVVLSRITYEFPSIVAGVVGLAITALLTVFKVGLGPHSRSASPSPQRNANKDAARLQETTAPTAEGAADSDGVALDDICPESRHPSGLSLEERSVNCEIVLEKPEIKALARRDNMNVPPSDVISALSPDGEVPPQVVRRVIEGEKLNRAPTAREVLSRTMPLWLTLLLLILTRIEAFELKQALRRPDPAILDSKLGNLGQLSISVAGRFSLQRILGTEISWTYELLYTPFILPFGVAGCAALAVFRTELATSPKEILQGVCRRIKGPAVALAGALMLVELLRTGDSLKDSPAAIAGTRLSEALGNGFVALAFPLGALGSFFSGSTTVSMLTFAEVQKVAADELGLRPEALVALQLCGASAGNAICLSNIIAATAVIGLHVSEGLVIKRVLLPVFAMYIICTAVLLPFVYS